MALPTLKNPNEFSIIRRQAQEGSDILHTAGGWPLDDCLHLLRTGMHTFCTDLKTEVINAILEEIAFVQPSVQFRLLQSTQCHPQVFLVFFNRIRKHQYVVQIYKDEGIDFILENPVHQSLKRCRRISQAKRHDYKFPVPQISTKSSFVY